MISAETIEAVRTRVRLVELVGEVVQLKQRGSSQIGLCPFHSEQTPSFHVRDQDNRYHCFGCGVSGDSITFTMERQGLSFPEAVEYLAQRAGIPVQLEGGAPREKKGPEKGEFYRINLAAQRYFAACLEKADKLVSEYLLKRGVAVESQAAFGIGWAPPQRDGLFQFLRGQRFTEELQLAAGLVRRSSRGDLYDTFRARIMFPIWIDPRRIAGFGGRILPEFLEAEAQKSAPKYLNSQETGAYHKSSIFYGLPQALTAVRAAQSVYLVEGYLDVIGLWQAGVQNTVATCGTALTDQHVRRLGQLVRKVFVLFDGDAAGRAAAAKSFQVFLNAPVDPIAVFLPDGEDPDTFAGLHGVDTAAALDELPSAALLDCFIGSLLKKAGVAGASELGAAAKGRAAEEVAQVLCRVENRIKRTELVKTAAFQLIIERSALEELVEHGGRRAGASSEIREELEVPADAEAEEPLLSSIPRPITQLPKVDQEILRAVIAKKLRCTGEILSSPEICDFLSSETRLFVEGLHALLKEHSEGSAEGKKATLNLLRSFGGSWLQLWKETYLMMEDKSVDFDQLFNDCSRNIRRSRIQAAVTLNDEVLKSTQDTAERETLIQNRFNLTKKLNSLLS